MLDKLFHVLGRFRNLGFVYVEIAWLILAFIPRHGLDISRLGLGSHLWGLDSFWLGDILGPVPYLLYEGVFSRRYYGIARYLIALQSGLSRR